MTAVEGSTEGKNDGPWLAMDDVAGVEALVNSLGWLRAGESVSSVERAGEGNMNLTLRLHTSQRTLILKQSRPWVEKYPQIEAPVERASVEAGFYRRVAEVQGVGSLMPALLASDKGTHTLLLEDLGEGSDLSVLYSASKPEDALCGAVDDSHLESLSSYLVNLHSATRGCFSVRLANRSMRRLNHQHIFLVPFAQASGVALEHLEPGLQEVADDVRGDRALLEQIGRLGDRYLEDGPCLLHGDFFPGSWLVRRSSTAATKLWVIDPEFCFFGDPEFDVAVALAHLLLARQGEDIAARWLELAFSTASEPLDASLVAGFAGVEVLRRLLGVAQLPLGPTKGFRALWVARGAAAVRSGVVASLLT